MVSWRNSVAPSTPCAAQSGFRRSFPRWPRLPRGTPYCHAHWRSCRRRHRGGGRRPDGRRRKCRRAAGRDCRAGDGTACPTKPTTKSAARSTAAAKDGGLRRLKNIPEPVRTFTLEPGTDAASISPRRVRCRPRGYVESLVAGAVIGLVVFAAVAALRPFLRCRPKTLQPRSAETFSIVILPFSNLSADSSQNYFVDALVDELTTYVSRIPEAFVIARNSAFTFKGKAVDIKQIGSGARRQVRARGLYSIQPTSALGLTRSWWKRRRRPMFGRKASKKNELTCSRWKTTS